MAVVTSSMSTFVGYDNRDYRVNLNNIKKEHTYVAIAGLNNQTQLEMLEKCDKLNILFKGEKAVNKKLGHGQNPRNTVIIFELKDD